VRGLSGGVGWAGRCLLDLLLPHRCLACGEIVGGGLGGGGTGLCPACWAKMGFLTRPWCACCGFPFSTATPEGTLCLRCAERRPPYRSARSVFRYNEESKGMILRFKHGDRTDAAPVFGRWMARAGAEILAEADLILPVPLHRWRLARRRYNQAALLAWEIGKVSHRRVAPDLLRRHRATAPQGSPGTGSRARNVKGAFTLKAGAEEMLFGRQVVLVDDVLASGSTLAECSRLLREGGATAVDVLTLAMVVRD